MGDTFDRVIEMATEAQLKEKASFVYEYYTLFPEHKFRSSYSILLLEVEKSDNLAIDENWDGKLSALKSYMKKSMREMEKKLTTNANLA